MILTSSLNFPFTAHHPLYKSYILPLSSTIFIYPLGLFSCISLPHQNTCTYIIESHDRKHGCKYHNVGCLEVGW